MVGSIPYRINDADQAHTDYAHLNTKSGREGWNRYLEIYRLYYDSSSLLPHLHAPIDRRETTPEKRVIYPIVHQPRDPSAPIILRREEINMKPASMNLNPVTENRSQMPQVFDNDQNAQLTTK